MIVNGNLEASVLANMPGVKYNMTLGEWAVMKCHPETMFVCAGMNEGSRHIGKSINHHSKGQTIHQCNWMNTYLMCSDKSYLNCKGT